MPTKRISKQLRLLQLRQVEEKLRPWQSLPKTPPPRGWVRTIREALGMSIPQLARRLRVTRQTMADLERREIQGSTTFAALRRAADAMDCDLVYAIVPRRELNALLEDQARQRASSEVKKVAHTMRLEAQDVDGAETQRLIDDTAANLLENPRTLWDMPQGEPKPRPRRDTPRR
ncbi:MAG: mobile mystery protein A [Armatimonadota bacterium]